jgi:hypothetical protein
MEAILDAAEWPLQAQPQIRLGVRHQTNSQINRDVQVLIAIRG